MSEVIFLGVGDAVSMALGHTSTLYRGSNCVLVDCGPSVPSSVFDVLPDPEQLDGIWITHQHADHCFGLATLLLMLRMAKRTRPLSILGGKGMCAHLRRLLALGYPGAFASSKCFPIEFCELAPGVSLQWQSLVLSTARTEHGVPCYALRIDDAGHSFCASGDGRHNAATLGLYRGADLLVHECHSLERSNPSHSCLVDMLPLVEIAGVRALALVHCEQSERSEVAMRAPRLLGPRAFVPMRGERKCIE